MATEKLFTVHPDDLLVKGVSWGTYYEFDIEF